jgi:hypothetical protein
VGVPADWIEHRRGDGELLGWMRPTGQGFVVIDRLGRTLTAVVDWLTAETTLENLGIGYLADRYELLVGDQWLPVEIVEVSTEQIRLKLGYWKAIDAPKREFVEQFPVGDTLRLANPSRVE